MGINQVQSNVASKDSPLGTDVSLLADMISLLISQVSTDSPADQTIFSRLETSKDIFFDFDDAGVLTITGFGNTINENAVSLKETETSVNPVEP